MNDLKLYQLDEDDAKCFEEYTIYVDWNDPKYPRLRFASGPHKNKQVARVIIDCPDDKEVDHRNRDPLDCRKCNMRIATRSQQVLNTGGWSNKKSGLPKGVFKGNGKKFTAIVQFNKKSVNLGQFSTVEKAKEAYNNKARELFGEFFPE